MQITISDNLKELRKKKNNTQEELAEFLTISIAAVSKWERGESYPDVELLPRIAVFYDTTVDDLLGVGGTRKQHKINEYMNKTLDFWKTGDSLACVEHWRKAANEFPNDDSVMFQLMQALTNAAGGVLSIGGKDDEAKKIEYLKEAVEIGEKLSAKANDQSTIYSAIFRLCSAYKDLGEVEKAKETANKLPPIYFSKDEVLLLILEGTELKTHSQEFLLLLLQSFNNMIIRSGNCGCYESKQTIQIYQKAIQICKLLFENGDYGIQHMSLCYWYLGIATCYAKMKDADAVIENLNAAAEHAIAHDLTEHDAPHTSLLFNTLKIKMYGKTSMDSTSQNLLKKMENEKFNFCRNNERFVEIRNRLGT
ncbi:MAG: helix-turn-helix domain-containing protein [Firmicutes bacterium]|nr:helix-turn-helix domain-containing protein [Bacillota bacterium]